MQIIVEGPDGSGKTTLILELAKYTGWKIVSGEGPEKYPGEMMERIARYLKVARYRESYSSLPHIFDRHPCVSHQVYSQFTQVSRVNKNATDQLYSLKNVIVYCRPLEVDELGVEQNKPHDTGAHLRAITSRHSEICSLYDKWAVERAHIIHRYWEPDSVSRTIRAIIATSGEKI